MEYSNGIMEIQSMFKMKLPEKDLKSSLTTFVPGVNSKLQFAPCVQFLPKPVLELVRVKKNWNVHEEGIAMLNSKCDIDILKTYKQHIEFLDSVVHLPFLLKHTSDSEKIFNCLYGVTISTQSSPPCKQISVIQIPVFKSSRTANKEHMFHIDIIPYESQPLELHFKAEFTCNNGYNYVCHLDSVFLNFKDFFLKLPIPQNLLNYDSSLQRKLFETLWEEFQKETYLGNAELKCCKSAICLKVSKEELTLLIEEHWKPFIVAKFDEFKCWVAIFLPPKNHLLMKIDIINDKPFINIMVDNISNLPWIALYLKEITKC